MDALGDDLVRCVAQTSAEAAIKVACVCKRWRDAVEGGEGGAFDIRNALAAIGETAIQADLVAALALSKMHVKMGKHTKKRNRYGGFYNVFTHASAVALFRSHGGFGRLEARMARRGKSGVGGK